MIKNQKLLSRICQLIAQTFAVSYEEILEDTKKHNVEEIIELLEDKYTIKY